MMRWSACGVCVFHVCFDWLCMHVMDVKDGSILIILWPFCYHVVAYDV